MILDNSILNSLAYGSHSKDEYPTFLHANQLISYVMAMFTSPIRFPGIIDSNLTNILASVAPLPWFHFLIPGCIADMTEKNEVKLEIYFRQNSTKNQMFMMF